MESRIARELKLRYAPVAVIFTNDSPAEAIRFKVGARGCVTAMLAAAARGKTAAFDRKTSGCIGGSVGLGFGNAYTRFPGGIDYFLSIGRGNGFREGEAYVKTPELARAFVEALPMRDIPFSHVVFKPLKLADADTDSVVLVCLLADPDQISALTVLANYGRATTDNVIVPMGAACQTFCLLPLAEAERRPPRAVIGCTDISARPYLDRDLLSFTVSLAMFREMEADVPGSFLEKEAWHKVRNRIPDPPR